MCIFNFSSAGVKGYFFPFSFFSLFYSEEFPVCQSYDKEQGRGERPFDRELPFFDLLRG